MSHDLLTHLHEWRAFDNSPGFHDLGAYHVPFESMISPCRVETTLSAGARSGARIALIAGGGAGKSSVVSHVLGPDAPSVAPIRIPVHPLGEGATTPERVANEILELLERYAHNVPTEPVIGTRRRVTKDTVARAISGSLSLGSKSNSPGRSPVRQRQNRRLRHSSTPTPKAGRFASRSKLSTSPSPRPLAPTTRRSGRVT